MMAAAATGVVISLLGLGVVSDVIRCGIGWLGMG
jgi:hypothetical protein